MPGMRQQAMKGISIRTAFDIAIMAFLRSCEHLPEAGCGSQGLGLTSF